VNTRIDHCDFGTLEGSGFVDLRIPRVWLLPGCYVVSIGIHDANGLAPLDLQLRAYPFSVASHRRDLGLTYLEHTWEHVADASSKSDPVVSGSARATAVRAAILDSPIAAVEHAVERSTRVARAAGQPL
jgi:hypothetical protein